MSKLPFEELYNSLGPKIDQDIISFRALYQMIENLNPTKILELGFRNGGTSRMWQNLVPEGGLVLSVDFSPGSVEDRVLFLDSPEVRLLVGDSHSPEIIAEAASFGPYDAIFIDGDHSYEGVKADYENYSPMVRQGGVISFHDQGHGPILRFWNELDAPDKRILKASLDIGVFYKA